jgi:GH25 family lysozyme M1 (1,4-beta-N-acetylmuramidase)
MRAPTGRPAARILLGAGAAAVLAAAALVGARAGMIVAAPAALPSAIGPQAAPVASGRAIVPLVSSRTVPAGGRPASHRPKEQQRRASHFNEGAPHSPRLLRELGGLADHRPRTGTPPGLAKAMRGVDVAAYQHPHGHAINWRRVARAGIQFAAVKATEGTYYKNPFALADLAQARAAGLSVMAYAFAIPNGNGGASSPVAQADYLISYLASAGGPLPPIMLDIEYNPYGAVCYGLSRAAMRAWIARFSAEIQARTGENPIVYGPVPWWQECTGGTAQFGQSPLWVPDYTFAGHPELTHGWASWAFWQYSSAGAVDGIDTRGHTDLDVLNPRVIPLLDSGPQVSTAGGTVRLRMASADPIAGQRLSLSARNLPAGTAITAAGRVTGRPSVAGSYRTTVRAADGKGRSGSVSFSWAVRPAPINEPTGMVRLGRGAQCLTALAAGPPGGTAARACTGSSAQTWAYAQDNTLRNGGQCLTVPQAAQGTAAELEQCDGAATQQWRLAYPRSTGPAPGPDHTALVNPGSGLCLAGRGAGQADGTALRACNGSPGQSWTLPPGPMTSGITGLCLDDRGDRTADNTEVDLWSCNGTAAQAWLAGPDGTVRVHGKCLDVSRGAPVAGTPVVLHSCTGTAAQVWNLTPGGAGVMLVNPGSGLCLADPHDAEVDGTQAVIAACAASDPGMSWRPS